MVVVSRTNVAIAEDMVEVIVVIDAAVVDVPVVSDALDDVLDAPLCEELDSALCPLALVSS